MNTQSLKLKHFLLELIINCLFFSVCVSICVSIFVSGHLESGRSNDLSTAALEAQNIAETVKAVGADTEVLASLLEAESNEGVYFIGYDEDWQRSADEVVYSATVDTSLTEDMMLNARIVIKKGDELIYELDIKSFVGAIEEVA